MLSAAAKNGAHVRAIARATAPQDFFLMMVCSIKAMHVTHDLAIRLNPRQIAVTSMARRQRASGGQVVQRQTNPDHRSKVPASSTLKLAC
jgi:sensor domain CHASE-containing protein